jgi:uncharacterized protein YbjT (DUF2867 family)
MTITAAIVGATGLVGRELLAQLYRAVNVGTVHVLTRRPLPPSALLDNPKLVSHQVDFDRLAQFDWPHCDVLFCCLGTTIGVAGSKEAFRAVDFGYVVESARRAQQAGASRLAVVSAMGANVDSRVFYNRVKGEMEQAVVTLGYESVLIFRPSLISGERPERRPAERMAQAAFKAVNPLLPRKYRSVSAAAVARAILSMSGPAAAPGVTVVESDRIQAFAGQNPP